MTVIGLPAFGLGEPDLPFAGVAAVATYLRAHGVAARVVDLNFRFRCHVEAELARRLGRRVADVARADLVEHARAWDERIRHEYALRAGPLRSDPPFGLSLLAEHNRSKIAPFLQSDDNIYAEVLPSLLDLSGDADGGVFGLSITAPSQLVAALTVARMIKAANADNVVVAGGAFVTLCLDAFTEPLALLADIDYAIPADGEQTFLELLADLDAGADGDRDGVVYRRTATAGDAPSYRPRAPSLELVRRLPAPDYTLFEESSRFAAIPYETARGCAWSRCKFCYHSSYYGSRYRPKPIANVVADLEQILARSLTSTVYFADAEIPPKRFAELSAAISEAGLDFSWWCLARLQRGWTPEVFAAGKRAGCREIDWGLEHVSPRLTQHIGKPVDVEQAMEIFRACGESGITVAVQSIVGLPSETDDERQQLFDFLAANAELFSSKPNFFMLGRNTEFYNQRERYGIEASRTDEDTFASGFTYLNRQPTARALVDQIDEQERRKRAAAAARG